VKTAHRDSTSQTRFSERRAPRSNTPPPRVLSPTPSMTTATTHSLVQACSTKHIQYYLIFFPTSNAGLSRHKYAVSLSAVPSLSAPMVKKSGSGKGNGGCRSDRPQPFFMEIDPSIVYFSHARIRTTFSGCGRRVEDTLAEIVEGRLKPEALPFITVIFCRATGAYFSLNNRRLWVLKECKKRGLLDNIRVRVRTEASRYTTETCALEAKLCLK